MTPEAVVLYLENNGVTVKGNTDKYFRLTENGVKAWYVENVPEPKVPDLVSYEKTARDKLKLKKLRRIAIEAEYEKERLAKEQDWLDNGTTPEAIAYRAEVGK